MTAEQIFAAAWASYLRGDYTFTEACRELVKQKYRGK